MQFAPCPTTVVFAKEFIYSLSKGDKTLEKGLRSQHVYIYIMGVLQREAYPHHCKILNKKIKSRVGGKKP